MIATLQTGTLTLAVTGMTCGSCRRHVEDALAAVPGVAGTAVDVGSGTAVVSYDPASATPGNLMEAVRVAGYGAAAAAAETPGLPLAAASCACCATR